MIQSKWEQNITRLFLLTSIFSTMCFFHQIQFYRKIIEMIFYVNKALAIVFSHCNWDTDDCANLGLLYGCFRRKRSIFYLFRYNKYRSPIMKQKYPTFRKLWNYDFNHNSCLMDIFKFDFQFFFKTRML